MNTNTISAIIITKNEESKIKKCLDSILFCNEIIVVDNGSTDKTLDIANEYGCKIYRTNDWPGFGRQKQRALDWATSTWVLSIDADEIVSEDLKNCLVALANNDDINAPNAYKIHRINKFIGKELRYGGWGADILIRFGKRANLKFTEDRVHESMLVSGSIGCIDAPMYHEARENLGEVLEKQARYVMMANKEKDLELGIANPIISTISAFLTFLNYYVIRMGFLDGVHGFFAAVSKAQGKFWKKSGL